MNSVASLVRATQRLCLTPSLRSSVLAKVTPFKSAAVRHLHAFQIQKLPCATKLVPSANPFGFSNCILREVNPKIQFQPVRTRVYQSWGSSRPKTVRAVPQRFKRLASGLWIRTRSGRHKHLWQKSRRCKLRMKTHVICNKQQAGLLERMVGKYWKRHRHYPNDPYSPYHVRNNFKNDKIYHKAPFYPLERA